MKEKKSQDSIPISKVQRAAKILGTGAKVGGNYVKYYTKKTFNPSLSKDTLHENNATDIYETLSQLKGSALKVAQMMSMDDQVLPPAYQEKFAMGQYNAPPLSYPLVVKTFKKYFDKHPDEVFEEFSRDAVNAASMGQVHKAKIDNKSFAVKIQYPGVANSISSDLKLVKPLAARLFNMNTADLNVYLEEVEERLIEETDYKLELKRANKIAEKCKHIPRLKFPHYYEKLSSVRILTMDWMEGDLLANYYKTKRSQESRNTVGQTIWDFFLFQLKHLDLVHADPHPGNFIVNNKEELIVLDFGCVKEFPKGFTNDYFKLLHPAIFKDDEKRMSIYEEVGFIKPEDSQAERKKLMQVFDQMLLLLAKPFHSNSFDFADDAYFQQIAQMGDQFSKDVELRKMNNARGSKHSIYLMRTFFGLYNLLHLLKAEVKLNYQLYR